MDRKKYIVEASDDVKKVMAMGVTHGGAIWTDTTDIENLEELNSDYINEHYVSLQDEAFNRGLTEAWELARSIWHDECGERSKLGCVSIQGVFDKYTAQEAIAKLKAYEEQNTADEIKVGDEVEVAENGIKFFVTKIYDADGTVGGINKDGEVRYWSLSLVKRTGRHFDIPKILAEMRT